ncbi:MAG: hypothetical protein K2Y14_10710 [Burkholderiales bacterium]|nr:hypothetical protein [Burkholderiales bacterium]
MMKLFTKNTFRNLALSALVAAVLSACGGGGSCAGCSVTPTPTPTPTPSDLTLQLSAPTQYPAGVALKAYLTMTNTSSSDASNLQYDIPSLTNYTSVTITADATGAGEDCSSIASGASCTFTANIPAGSKPGSFTVTATPLTEVSTSVFSKILTKLGLQARTLSLKANIGLSNLPPAALEKPLFIMPQSQTLSSSAESTTVLLSVVVNSVTSAFNKIVLVNENGIALPNASLVSIGSGNYLAESVATFKVVIPAGKALQQVQAYTYNDDTAVCTANTTCSNIATINFTTSSAILDVQPSYAQLNENNLQQVVTLTNIGTAAATSITIPSFASPLSLKSDSDNCTGTTLESNNACTFTVVYTPGLSSGTNPYQITYKNSAGSQQTADFALNYNNPNATVSIDKNVVNGITTITLTNLSANLVNLGSIVTDTANVEVASAYDLCSNQSIPAGKTCTIRLATTTAPLSNSAFTLNVQVGSGTVPFSMVANASASTSFDMTNARYVLIRYMWESEDVDIQVGVRGANPQLTNTTNLFRYVGYAANYNWLLQYDCIKATGPVIDPDLVDNPFQVAACYGEDFMTMQPAVFNWSGDNVVGGEEDVVFDKDEFIASQGGNYSGTLWMALKGIWHGYGIVPPNHYLNVSFELYPEGTSFSTSSDLANNKIWTADRAPIYSTSFSPLLNNVAGPDNNNAFDFQDLGPIDCTVTGTNITNCNVPSLTAAPAIPVLTTSTVPSELNASIGTLMGPYTANFSNYSAIMNESLGFVSLYDSEYADYGGYVTNVEGNAPLTLSPYAGAPYFDYTVLVQDVCKLDNNGQCSLAIYNYSCPDYDPVDEPFSIWVGGESLGQISSQFNNSQFCY